MGRALVAVAALGCADTGDLRTACDGSAVHLDRELLGASADAAVREEAPAFLGTAAERLTYERVASSDARATYRAYDGSTWPVCSSSQTSQANQAWSTTRSAVDGPGDPAPGPQSCGAVTTSDSAGGSPFQGRSAFVSVTGVALAPEPRDHVAGRGGSPGRSDEFNHVGAQPRGPHPPVAADGHAGGGVHVREVPAERAAAGGTRVKPARTAGRAQEEQAATCDFTVRLADSYGSLLLGPLRRPGPAAPAPTIAVPEPRLALPELRSRC